MKFVLWNRECEQLIKQPAVDLKELLILEGEFNPLSIPQAVDDLVTKSLAFKVKLQPTYKRCSVIQVSEDSQLIDCLLERITPDQDLSALEKGKSVGPAFKEDDGFECQSLSATSDYDPDCSAYLTPLKRLGSSALSEDAQDIGFAQMSSTKNAKHISKD
ncbi:PREDICTED: uncharacterized protein LOC109341754 [Lupinus angustifolius]|uniref:uncharacterized protein LOC109341754 n=1 Tax=Lupinus angustifolius TaxID=3871 RepID=UPI00092FC668|nr:PREDICTED: uncharacterized protein LOC109341754 [Lupinus angustifolius]